jgi:uncharacterized protein YpbB
MPQFWRDAVSGTRAYYSGEDVSRLDKHEVIEILVQMRFTALKAMGAAFLLLSWFFVSVALLRTRC